MIPKALIKLAGVITMLALLSACGPSQVRGEAPFVQVNTWSIEGTQLSMALRIRNVNDEELPLTGVNFTVLLNEVELVTHDSASSVVVAANGFETLNLNMTASDEGTALLASLQNGELKSLPYDFQGYVVTEGDRRLRFQREGHIYTVPGRPGQFR